MRWFVLGLAAGLALAGLAYAALDRRARPGRDPLEGFSESDRQFLRSVA